MKKLKWLDKACNSYNKRINSWDRGISGVLSYKYPCCEACTAKKYGMDMDALRSRMEHYLDVRPCLDL